MPVQKNFKRQVRQRMAETGERYTVVRSALESVKGNGDTAVSFADDPAVEWLLESREPAVRYRTLTDVLGRPEADSDVRSAKAAILDGPAVRAIFAAQRSNGRWGAGGFGHKYTGPAHVLALLAQFRVPGDDPRLRAAVDFWLAWLGATRERVARTVNGKVRYHAGREGSSIDTLCLFGMARDPRLREHVEFLLDAQWPDGGWNCDVRPQARNSSFMETFDATRGLFRYAAMTGDGRARDAAVASTDIFVKRGVLRGARSGTLISGRITQLHWPRGYDVLHALEAIAPGGLGDSRLAEALDLIESKRTKEGRWRANGPKPKVNPRGPGEVIDLGGQIRDEMVTLRALSVLRAAGRVDRAPTATKRATAQRTFRRTSAQTLSALLLDSGIDSVVVEKRPLVNDDTGTYFRVTVDDGSTRLYREYATTSHTANKEMAREIAFAAAMRAAGLPVPDLVGQIAGSSAAGGDPAAALFEDLGGEPLAFFGGRRKATEDDLFMSVSGSRRDAMWAEVGAMLGRLHRVDVEVARALGRDRLLHGRYKWPKDALVRFPNLVAEIGDRYPASKATTDALAALKGELSAYLEARPLTMRWGDHFFPSVLLDRDGRRWVCRSWIAWDAYACIGDPMRDVASIERLVRVWTGAELPASFYKAYGRPVDDVVLVFSELLTQCAALTTTRSKRTEARGYAPPDLEVDPAIVFPVTLDRLREGFARA